MSFSRDTIQSIIIASVLDKPPPHLRTKGWTPSCGFLSFVWYGSGWALQLLLWPFSLLSCIPCSSCKVFLSSPCLRVFLFHLPENAHFPCLLALAVSPHPQAQIRYHNLSKAYPDILPSVLDQTSSRTHATEMNLSTYNTVFPSRLWAAQVWGLHLVPCYTTQPGTVPGTQWSLGKYFQNERMPDGHLGFQTDVRKKHGGSQTTVWRAELHLIHCGWGRDQSGMAGALFLWRCLLIFYRLHLKTDS